MNQKLTAEEGSPLDFNLESIQTEPPCADLSTQAGRLTWAEKVVMAPAEAFEELMAREDRLLQDQAIQGATTDNLSARYVDEVTLREMHSIFTAAHPHCDWPILNTQPIDVPFYRS